MADSLLQEVDEALRADRAGALWNRHKQSILLFVVAVILGTAGNSAWQHYRQVRGGKMLLALSENQQMLEAGKAAEAAMGFKKIADDASGEFKALALVWQARALVSADKKEDAIVTLKSAVTGGEAVWSDIACLRLAGLDEAAAEGCLHAKANSPLAATRAEWAIATRWAKGDHAGALGAIRKMLEDTETSADSRARLTQWAASMGEQEGKK